MVQIQKDHKKSFRKVEQTKKKIYQRAKNGPCGSLTQEFGYKLLRNMEDTSEKGK